MSNEALFAQVKRKINYTWEDDDTTARVNEIIDNAIPSLIDRLGITDNDFDFSVAGEENTIFLNYCFYEWNHALADFENNYAHIIDKVRTRNTVNSYIQSGEVNE